MFFLYICKVIVTDYIKILFNLKELVSRARNLESQFFFLFMVGIYKITNPIGKVYVGQSKNIEYRFTKYRSKASTKGQRKIYESLLNFGINNHIFEVIEECDISSLNERERYWQEYYQVLSENGLNCSYVKTNYKKGKNSYETLKLMSDCKKGDKNPMYNKIVSKETRSILSYKGKLRKHTVEEIQKVSGCNNYQYRPILNTETGIYYGTIKEACESLVGKYTVSVLYRILNGDKINKTKLIRT